MTRRGSRKRLDTLEFGAAKPSSTSGLFLDEMKRKESYRQLLSGLAGKITSSKNPGSEILERLKITVLRLEQLDGDKEENKAQATKILKAAFDMLVNVVIDQDRNSYFAGEEVMKELRKRYKDDSAAIQREYNRVVSERKARFVQDTQDTLINFAAMYEVASELVAYIPTHDHAIVPGARGDSGEAVDRLLSERHAIAAEVRGRTMPGGLADPNLPIPEIPKAPKRMKTDPLLLAPASQRNLSFDHADLQAQHDVKVANVREQSFVGKLRDLAPHLAMDDSQPPSAPKGPEQEVSEKIALKDFERLFVPLFEELIVIKIREYGGNFQEAIRAIASRTFINAGQDKSPFHAYVERNMAKHGSPQPIYRKFAQKVMEKKARKIKNRFTEPMHEYLQSRLKPDALVQLSPEAFDYEVSQTVKWMFSTVYQWLVKDDKELGPFVWLSYYFDPYNRESAIDFYKDVHGIVETMYQDAIERHRRKQQQDEGFSATERATNPGTPKSLHSAAKDEDIENEVTKPNLNIKDVFDSLGAPSDPEPSMAFEGEPVPYSTKSDIPPRESQEVRVETSSFPNTLPPPKPELKPTSAKQEPTRTVEHVEDEDGEAVTREFFVSRDAGGNVKKVAKQPPAAGDMANLKPRPAKHEGGTVAIPDKQVSPVPKEPSVIINPRREAERNEKTLPSRKKKRMAIPQVPKAPRVPSFVEQESTPDAETVKRAAPPEAKQSRWSRWSRRAKKRLGAIAVVAAAGVAALIGVRSQQAPTNNVETTTHKTAEPPKQVPPQKVAPAPTANVVKPPVQDDPSEVGPKSIPNLDDKTDGESEKIGAAVRVDLSKARTERLRNVLTTGEMLDDGKSSYSSQIYSTFVEGQPLSAQQQADLKALNKKVNLGSYASAMKKWGNMPAHEVRALAAAGSTYEDRSLLRSFLRMHGDPSKWKKTAQDPNTGASAPFQEVHKKELEYYEQKYEAEFLAYGMGDKGNIHTRKPNNRMVQLKKDGRFPTYIADIGKIVGYFEENTQTGMFDRPKVPGQKPTPLYRIPGQQVPGPQKYGFLDVPTLNNSADYPDGIVPTNTGRAFTHTTDRKQRLVNPGSSKNVKMDFIKAGADRYTQQVKEDPANILRLSMTYRLTGGTTFWQLIENQIEHCGQPDRVKEAARRCLNNWRKRGVNDLPFKVVANDGSSVMISIRDKRFLDDMTNTVAMAHGGYGKFAGNWFLKGGLNDPRNKSRTKAPAVTPNRFAHVKAEAEAYTNTLLKVGGTIPGTKRVAKAVEEQVVASRLKPDVEKFVLSGLRYYQKQGHPMYTNVKKQADGTYTKEVHPKLASYLKRVMDTKVNPQPSISERVAAAKAQREAEEHAKFMAEAETLDGADMVELNGVPKVWRIPRAEAMRPINYIEKSILDSLTWQAVNATHDRARVAALVSKKQHVSAICMAMRNAYKKKFIPSVKPFIDFPLPERWHTKLADALGSDWSADQGPYQEPPKEAHPPMRYAAVEEEVPVSGVRRRAGAPSMDDVA